MSDRSRSFMWNSRSNEGQGQGHYFCDLTCDLNSSRRDLYGDILLFAVAPLMRSQIEVKVWPWNGCYYITGVVNSDCLVWNCGAGRDVSNGVSQARLSEGSTQISTFYSRVAFFVRHAVWSIGPDQVRLMKIYYCTFYTNVRWVCHYISS